MKRKAWITAAFLLLGTVPSGWNEAWAEPALTLEEAQKEGVQRSPLYLQTKYKGQATAWKQQEAFSVFLPHLSFSGIHYFDNKFQQALVSFAGGPPVNFTLPYPYTVLNLDASWTIFDGFTDFNHYDAAVLSRQAADLDSQWARFQLEQEIRLRYYQAIAAGKLSFLGNENVKTLEDHLRVVKDQLKAGQATRYDVLRVEVQLDEARSEKLSADDNAVLAREKLSQTMGLPKDPRPLAGELPIPNAKTLSGELRQDLSHRPDVESKILAAQAAGKRKAEAGGFWFPKISLVGEYQYYDFASRDLLEPKGYPNAYQVGLAASWNLFDGAASFAREREADSERKRAEAEAQAAQLQAPYDLDFWRKRFHYSAVLYGAKLADVEKAKESVRLARLGFKAGVRTTTDVLDSELEYFRAGAGAVAAQVDAVEALINVELALGKRVNHE